jgi:hypothetical protein
MSAAQNLNAISPLWSGYLGKALRLRRASTSSEGITPWSLPEDEWRDGEWLKLGAFPNVGHKLLLWLVNNDYLERRGTSPGHNYYAVKADWYKWSDMTLLVKDANTQPQSLSTQSDAAGNLACVNVPAVVVGGIATPVSATAPVPTINTAAAAALDGSGTITTGGTAQLLFGGVVPVNGFLIANPAASGDTLYFSDAGTAVVAGAGSIPVAPGAIWTSPSGYKPAGAVSIIGATTADKFTARRW